MGGDGSGGARQGQQGKVYTNRSDLSANRTPQTASPVVAAQTPNAQPNMSQLPQVVPPTPQELYQTQRPNEAVTAGLPNSPGPGPEVMPQATLNTQVQTLSQLLNSLATRPGSSPATQFLASYMNQGNF